MKNAEFLIEYRDLKQKLNSISKFRDQVFLKLVYGLGARVGEVTKHKTGEFVNKPIGKNNIIITDEHLIVKVLTEKTHIWRKTPISRKKEAWITEPIITYSNELVGEYLFPFSTRWGEKVFAKYFDTQHIHLLRKWRATHLLQRKLPEHVIMRMLGWTDTQSLHRVYNQSVVEDYIDLI